MRVVTILATLFALVPAAMALAHGEVPVHVAVRSDGKGGIKHFYKKDEEEFFRKRAMEKKRRDRIDERAAAAEPDSALYSDPDWTSNPLLSDSIPVQSTEGGIASYSDS
ncbi:hypothetical protein M231_02299 [Tremella mesenterica]|uniref:Uncharacterized protein n=1 Tax=Tremella mesenterica TaxID=5217 RepID=A0A4Q1BR75_TREME|nr:hypothetical protein M231_02299 [Tremella mesenterica]